MMEVAFWDNPETVERFAAREPDEDLTRLTARFKDPEKTRVLDLGSAGGRNTLMLAEKGFDVWAVDASAAMVEHTRNRLAPILGAEAARERVRLGPMDDLSAFADNSFALVVAFGIFHNARDWAEWQRAVSEVTRILAPEGYLFVYHFTPEVDLTGEGVRPIAGEDHTFEGVGNGRGVLLETSELDREMARHGLRTVRPSETIRREAEGVRRVLSDALYVKQPGTAGTSDPET